MVQIYSPDFILSFQTIIKTKVHKIEDFVNTYNKLIDQDHIKPLFSQTNKYDLFPKKKSFKKFRIKNKNVWSPTIPKTNNEKIKKTIKIILNKITEKNYNTLIETLICEINKFTSYDILEILSKEIPNKIIYDCNFQNIYVKLCSRIWSMKKWHENLITIVVDDNDKFYWHKNTSLEDNKLNGPYNTEEEIREYTNKCINFKYVLLDTLYKKFKNKDKYINKSNVEDIEDDIRYKYRRNIFSILEFIGILYKKNMLSEKIIHVIMIELLNINGESKHILEEYIESFCILWKIVNEKIICPIQPKLINDYFNYILTNIMPMKWSTRITFMLEDFIEKYENKSSNVINKQKRKDNFSRNVEYNKKNIKDSDNENNDDDDENNFDKIEEIIYDFKNDSDYVSTVQKLQKYSSKNLDNMLDLLLYCSVENIKNNKKYIELFSKCKFIKDQDILNVVNRFIKNIDEIVLDIPNAKINLLKFIKLLSEEFNIKSLTSSNIILSLT